MNPTPKRKVAPGASFPEEIRIVAVIFAYLTDPFKPSGSEFGSLETPKDIASIIDFSCPTGIGSARLDRRGAPSLCVLAYSP